MNEEKMIIESIKELARVIYSGPPGDPNCFQLGIQIENTENKESRFEVETSEITEGDLDDYVNDLRNESATTVGMPFEMAYYITLEGMKLLYDKDDPTELTREEVNRLREYTQYYGYNLIVTANDNEDPWDVIENGGVINKIQIKMPPI